MRDLFWRLSLTFLALAGLGVLGLDLGLGTPPAWGEPLTAETPEACVAAFLQAVQNGDSEASLALWRPDPRLGPAFGLRRSAKVQELLAYGPGLTYRVESVQWWRTCCEPTQVSSPQAADGARLAVTLAAGGLPESAYLFDLLSPDDASTPATGHRQQRWEIVDVYPQNEPPIAFSWQATADTP
jgi:hypothetical protein